MPHSRDLCDRFWNLPSKAGEETRREADRDDSDGQAPWPHNYLFMPEELAAQLRESGVRG
jgi:hypothetical protein